MASRLGLRFEHRSARHTSRQWQRNGIGRRGKPWRLLRVCSQADRCARSWSGNIATPRTASQAMQLAQEELAIAGRGFKCVPEKQQKPRPEGGSVRAGLTWEAIVEKVEREPPRTQPMPTWQDRKLRFVNSWRQRTNLWHEFARSELQSPPIERPSLKQDI